MLFWVQKAIMPYTKWLNPGLCRGFVLDSQFSQFPLRLVWVLMYLSLPPNVAKGFGQAHCVNLLSYERSEASERTNA